ncbi:MAG TPA: hypothetical protein ENJ45_02085 [Phaeodactylibacter sp.]|nr:hypothetical protein [Phaeodactylibacter sp.]
MFKYILEQSGNINWMAAFGLLTFFSIFLISLFAIFGSSKEYIDKMSKLPLNDSYSHKREK